MFILEYLFLCPLLFFLAIYCFDMEFNTLWWLRFCLWVRTRHAPLHRFYYEVLPDNGIKSTYVTVLRVPYDESVYAVFSEWARTNGLYANATVRHVDVVKL